jgi:pimeloyl-ACP methyl ester carboxylesterase
MTHLHQNKAITAVKAVGRWLTSHKLITVILVIASMWCLRQMTKEQAVLEQLYTIDSVESKDGTIIGYRQYGNGPGLILVHGGMMASQDFTQLASILSDHFTVYVPDRRGRGLSGSYGDNYDISKAVEDMQALLDKTGAHNVFGLSAGAIIALQSTLQLPEIHKLAIYEPPLPLPGYQSTWDWVTRYDQDIAQDNLGAALITVAKGTGDSSFLTILPRFIAEPFMNFAIKAQAQDLKPNEVPLQQLILTMHDDAMMVASMEGKIHTFKDIHSQVLLLGGSETPDNLQAPLQVLSTIVPDAKRFEFKGVGHLAATNDENPRMVAQELYQFFNESN